ncbi:unnamed protein product [Brassica oleracea]|uniref:(rape) hypothetical protein n=1 Tax=Brassica napus TaxID=3708 RepID=A0A816J3R6_BRANA|nr:unnamed protein product [Brassica napus]
MLHHGLYLFTLPTNELGSHSILFLERHVRWPTMLVFHFFLSRCIIYSLHCYQTSTSLMTHLQVEN